MSACKKSCCWSPWDVCAKKKECGCHTSEQPIHDRLTALEIERAESVLKFRRKR